MALDIRSTEKHLAKYPRLMETSTGRIVLFTEDRKGVVLAVGDTEDCTVGDFVTNWVMEQFFDCNEIIHLENS